MSIYASWPEVGEHGENAPDSLDGESDGTVLSYMRSHVYPDPDSHPPGRVGISHIPGFIWRDGLPEERRNQDEDDPVAPFLRLHVSEWDSGEGMPMITGTVVLTPAAAKRLRDDLTEWLERPRHDR
ncbi:hypothetical protein [Nocardia wallacei]|uniref:hypothetical protein n=1 Tax=Nocardia wallacei TaxID=480035 RepID=UPI0024553362|nr:hypothetical protein [Nocardia wallacei]